MPFNRRKLLIGAGAASLSNRIPFAFAQTTPPLMTVTSRTIDVKGRATKIFSLIGAKGASGLIVEEGERFTGEVANKTSAPLIMHWHGQVFAAADQDRSRKGGGGLAPGASDKHDFLLTPGTHWMHSHQLTEQQLLAAPMIALEKNRGEAQDVVIMLHDFAFRSPEEILSQLRASAALGGSSGQASSGAGHASPAMQPGMGPGGMMMSGNRPMTGNSRMPAMVPHANDVAYDAYLANDRTLDDPEVIRIDKGGRVRLRIINGATATAFFIDTGRIQADVISVDGTPCEPLRATRFPLAQGQRIDLSLVIPAQGGAFPIVAEVEGDSRRTGVILASAGAEVSKVSALTETPSEFVSLALEAQLRAKYPPPPKRADRTYHLMLGEESGYRWTINGKIHGEHAPIEAKLGERVEIMFMNPTMMTHPMHLHGHHFQVVGIGSNRFSGPIRDTVIVPPHTPILVAFDADKRGDWNLHCHHLYHMAAGMMTELSVS
ncbi:multicopper oxidase domain-containing protein [soil metagenome]